MMSEEQFNAAARELAELNGIPEDLAAELLADIGDTPELDQDGLVIAHADDGTEHRLQFPTEGEE